MRFKTFLIKEEELLEEELLLEQDESRLVHLEHAEDHHINAGDDGFKHAFNTLHQTHQLLTKQKSNATVTTKYDGSPSTVFGHHPENGKFFVASKSAFNKNPKINYTHEDIEKNHGHAPGLVSKLKAALDHLPKVTKPGKVYQGDFMYHKDDGDVRDEGGKHHFTPNTITYSTPKNSDHGKKISKAKMGMAVYTSYSGDNLENMKVNYNHLPTDFGKHDDVHIINPGIDHQKVKYEGKAQDEFLSHMRSATDLGTKMKHDHMIDDHPAMLKTHINKTIRDGTKPSLDGLKEHITNHHQKKADKVKSDAAKEKHLGKGRSMVAHIDNNSEHFNNTLELHKHIQNAKNVLVKALSSHNQFDHHVNGQPVKPEGAVAVINNRPTKLNDREEFNRLNFQTGQGTAPPVSN